MNRHVQPPVRPLAAAAERDSGGAPARTRREGVEFARARNHSRRVRFFRRALPAGVVIVLALALAVNYLQPLSLAVDLPFELGRVSLSGTRVKMEFPKLQGFTQDNRGYSVTAEAASQDLTAPNRIDLETIAANLELADHGWAKLSARTGSYDTKTEQITLGDGVHFSTAAGYGGDLDEATIDIKGGRLVSEHPVELTYLDGKLTADRMEVSQKDSRALLTGNVQLNFRMPPPDEQARAPAAPAADGPPLRGSSVSSQP